MYGISIVSTFKHVIFFADIRLQIFFLSMVLQERNCFLKPFFARAYAFTRVAAKQHFKDFAKHEILTKLF